MVLLLIGVVATGAALCLGLFVLLDRRPEEDPVAARSPGDDSGDSVSLWAVEKEIPPLHRRAAAFASKLTPTGYGRRLQHRLDVAGNPKGWTPEQVLALKGLGLVILGLLCFLLATSYGLLVTVVATLGGAVAGFYVPDLWIKNLGDKRQSDLRKGLPDAIDMMTVCVEAGLGFDAALSRVATNLDGPTAMEFARVMQERQFGKSRVEALRAMSDRSTVGEVRTFSSAVIQSSELGISIGDVLRSQAHDMRIKRRQRAEELAQKLPVKILFPLLTCIFPVLFIVILAPAGMGIWEALADVAAR